MKVIVKGLDEPATVIPYLQKLGVRHLIYGVQPKNFQSFAIALIQTLDILLPQKMTGSLKEAWFTLITKIGNIMTTTYADCKLGITSTLKKISAGVWKNYFCVLTHETLSIFRDQEHTKLKEDIWIKYLDDINIHEGDSIPKTGQQMATPHCFSICVGGIPMHFCCDTREDLAFWLDELGARITAHQRIVRQSDSDDSNSEGSTPTNSAKIKRNVVRLRKKIDSKKQRSKSSR